ncbi:MAG: hypothetical protein K2J83_01235 [Clostridia bacterium]|nr:hypothetical protein [Clostridia bacterium]
MILKRAATSGIFACLLILAASFFCACSKPITYPFLHDTDQIIEIRIVAIKSDRDYTTGDFEYDILAEIEDRDSFIERFKQIKFHRFLIGDPTELYDGKDAILIYYENGDHEYVGHYAQSIVKNSIFYFGKVNCNKAQFEEFIQEWIE